MCNGRTITYNDDSVSLATTDKRVTAEYVTPVNKNGTPFADYWTDEWEKAEATLHKRDGTYSLHVAVKKNVDPLAMKNPGTGGSRCRLERGRIRRRHQYGSVPR